MNLIVTVDHHFVETPDGKVWCASIHNSKFWDRYTAVFDKVYVVCRYRKASDVSQVDEYLLSSAEGVEFVGVKDFIGPKDYLRNFLEIKQDIKRKLSGFRNRQDTVAIYRIPSTLGFLVYDYLEGKGAGVYGVELVADPETAYQTSNKLINFIVTMRYANKVRLICKNAASVGYVTKDYLQKKYPTWGFQTNYSSGGIDEEDYFIKNQVSAPVTFVHVSNMHCNIKGIDTLLLALSQLKKEGYHFKCFLIGDGRHRQFYEKMVQDENLQDEVSFTGAFSAYAQIRAYLMKSDVFVFPSHAEGLPRVVIEAMSCSLAVIASPVGGTPELLQPDYLVDFHDVKGYYKVMRELLEAPANIMKIGKENYEIALTYSVDKLMQRRQKMYNELMRKKLEGVEPVGKGTI